MTETKYVLVWKGSMTGPAYYVVMTEEQYYDHPEGAILEKSFNKDDLIDLADMKNEEERDAWDEQIEDYWDSEEF
jgi:hypothetical protein